MRLFTVIRASVVVLAGALVLGTSAAAAPASSSNRSDGGSKTLTFDVHFSPFELVRSSSTPDPNTGLGVGDQLIFHDLFFVNSNQVGDEGGNCVIVDASQALANCVSTIRLAGGTITAQFLNSPPPLKVLAITGGSGSYRRVAGDGTLLEHGDGTGTETLHLFGVRD
jgi:hypothetical protein